MVEHNGDGREETAVAMLQDATEKLALANACLRKATRKLKWAIAWGCFACFWFVLTIGVEFYNLWGKLWSR